MPRDTAWPPKACAGTGGTTCPARPMAATHMPHRCGRRVWEDCLRRLWPRRSSIRCGTKGKPTLPVCGTKVCPPPTNGMRAWCTASRDPRRIPTRPRRFGRRSKSLHPKRLIRDSRAYSSSSAYCQEGRALRSSVRGRSVAQPEFLHHRRREISPLCRLDQSLKNTPSMAGLLLSEETASDCLFKLVFVENLKSSIRRNPQVEEEVDDRFKCHGIRAPPSHRLKDVGIVPRPGSIRAVNATHVEGLILKEEPHRPVPCIHHDLPEILHGFRRGELVRNHDHTVCSMEEIRVHGDAAARRTDEVKGQRVQSSSIFICGFHTISHK